MTPQFDNRSFVRVKLFEVTQHGCLPPGLEWLKPGAYAVYKGKWDRGVETLSAKWAWYVEYVNGVTLEAEPGVDLPENLVGTAIERLVGSIPPIPKDTPSCLGYTLFLARESLAFGTYAGLLRPPLPGFPDLGPWLLPPALFPALFDSPASLAAVQHTAVGRLDCVQILTSTFRGIEISGLYHRRTQMLVAMRLSLIPQRREFFDLISDPPRHLGHFVLAETNVPLEVAASVESMGMEQASSAPSTHYQTLTHWHLPLDSEDPVTAKYQVKYQRGRYVEAFKRWQELPWWRRLFTKPPRAPAEHFSQGDSDQSGTL